MYITVNNNTYQNAERVKGSQWVELRADNLLGVTPSGTVTRYRDDGFEIGTDDVADYLRVEAISGGFRLTNVPVPQPVEPVEQTPKERREAEYETRQCIVYDGESLTVDAANQLYLAYMAEGQTDRAQALGARIAAAKESIRAEFPDT